MTIDEALDTWRHAESGLRVLLGDWQQIEQATEALAAAGLPVRRLGRELLELLPDRERLLATEERLAPRPEPGEQQLAWQTHRQEARRALGKALGSWLASVDRPLAVRDFELPLGEKLPLERLAEAAAPLLLLVPGRREASGAVVFAPDEAGTRLPPAWWRLAPLELDRPPVEAA